MEGLVKIKNGKLFTTSLVFSEKFELSHRHVLEKIRNLNASYSTIEEEFSLEEFTNSRGRKYPNYVMTRKGFMFLVMNTGAKGEKLKKIWDMQIKFIEAFDRMEEMLLKQQVNQNNLEWRETREQGKIIRKKCTDVISDFVEYATKQGSTSVYRYYGNLTKMEYKALQLIQQKEPKLRETLDTMQLYQLIICENIVKEWIKKYMEENKHYKEIYILVKQKVEEFAKTLYSN